METLRTNRRLITVVLTAAVMTFLLMVAGNAVRVMDASGACPDWPTCFGKWTPPESLPFTEPAAVQYAHRVLALAAAVLTGLAATWSVVSLRGRREFFPIGAPLVGAFLLIVVEGFLGSQLVTGSETSFQKGLHMAAALSVLGLVTASLTVLFHMRNRISVLRFDNFSPFARLSLIGLAGVFILLVSGTVVSASGAAAACTGWPLCSSGIPADSLGWLAFAHRAVVLLVGVLLAVQFLSGWKSQRSQPAVLTAVTGVFLLLLGQALVGAVNAERGYPADLVGLHASASAALWVVQVVLVISTVLAARTREDEAVEAGEPLLLTRRFKDFVILSKPVIVLLLLVTTYAGMVVGGKALPSASLAFWTLLGGALAAGGSSALNQFIDRDTDADMQRTAKRPLPDGRLKPAEGLAYGVGACLAAFFLLAVNVNLLAAVLSFAGMVYYVLLYSIWLKRMTVQNIVIGGGAGAIPPLVGWAAATGALNVPSLFLFAIIFLWTPPHFWALAIVRTKDYARGRVPMLPVIRGEKETRRQIFIYTLELVALTLLMPVFKLTGTVYLISAVLLGGWLIHTAWRVLVSGGNKTAWKMYRYSSMYLAFLMLALVVDVLI